MLTLAGAIACSALFGCDAQAVNNSVEFQNFVQVAQGQTSQGETTPLAGSNGGSNPEAFGNSAVLQ